LWWTRDAGDVPEQAVEFVGELGDFLVGVYLRYGGGLDEAVEAIRQLVQPICEHDLGGEQLFVFLAELDVVVDQEFEDTLDAIKAGGSVVVRHSTVVPFPLAGWFTSILTAGLLAGYCERRSSSRAMIGIMLEVYPSYDGWGSSPDDPVDPRFIAFNA
jgi:hypothetical protein